MEYTYCNKTGKRCYTKKDAQYAINLATKKHWRRTMADVPKRIYFCYEWGWWHLTKEATKYDGHKTREKKQTRYSNERRRIKRMEDDIYRYSREYR